ncbi:MAG TPA: sigma factor-like helix-turn-helix DNA-binding protein [Kofleriaceae bacterium]|jgi:RNA polymerase sigma-70 factor (ECF subfamily)|nr:sigma factor-like helix-turn-helix DNA-binding protein [Kofleriaceae bacterium]
MMAGSSDDGDDSWSAAVARAHAAWPAGWVPLTSFVEHLRARLPAGRAPAEALPELAVEDLYLAFACALGVTPALESFARTLLAGVDAHVARFDASAVFKDEVRQILATKLLVAAPGEAPAIADYAGRAPLSAWVRIAAIRAALNLRRGNSGEVERAAMREVDELAAAGDVELDVIRRRYRPAFEAAIARALAALPVRDRTLLRLRLVEGVEVDRIATMYGVHRTTMTRWLADVRAKLFDETRRILTAELGATDVELDSLAELIRSQLHVSLVRLLREP